MGVETCVRTAYGYVAGCGWVNIWQPTDGEREGGPSAGESDASTHTLTQPAPFVLSSSLALAATSSSSSSSQSPAFSGRRNISLHLHQPNTLPGSQGPRVGEVYMLHSCEPGNVPIQSCIFIVVARYIISPGFRTILQGQEVGVGCMTVTHAGPTLSLIRGGQTDGSSHSLPPFLSFFSCMEASRCRPPRARTLSNSHLSLLRPSLSSLLLLRQKRPPRLASRRSEYIHGWVLLALPHSHLTAGVYFCFMNNPLLPGWALGCVIALRRTEFDLTVHLQGHSPEIVARSGTRQVKTLIK